MFQLQDGNQERIKFLKELEREVFYHRVYTLCMSTISLNC